MREADFQLDAAVNGSGIKREDTRLRAFAERQLDSVQLHFVVKRRKPDFFKALQRADGERHRFGELLPYGLQRVEVEVSLAQGANFELFAANIGTGLSTNEIVTTVKHVGEGGRSRQTVRSVLNGKATGSYLGKVEVARGAQQTDAEQSVKAMLLDRGATANCKPELEIFADDVKCAHGASVGELDAMQLFYAESRGLDPASARALLLEGFVMGLWDSAKQGDAICEAAREALRRVVSPSPMGEGGAQPQAGRLR